MFVIGKSAGPRCFKHVRNLADIDFKRKHGWMGSFFEEWLHKLDRKFVIQERKVVMIVDNCPAHPKFSGLKAINLQFLQPNTTSYTQQMDQGVIRCVFALLFSYLINKVNQIVIECLDFAVESLHCLKNSMITKTEA